MEVGVYTELNRSAVLGSGQKFAVKGRSPGK